MTQAQANTINTVAGAAAAEFQLQQAAAGVLSNGANTNTAGGTNRQVVYSASGAATMANANQSLLAGVNTTSVGVTRNNTITQLATNVGTNNINSQQATGGSVIGSGTQSSVGMVNAIR